MLLLEASGIRFSLPSQTLSLRFDCTILSHARSLQGNLVFACSLPQQPTTRSPPVLLTQATRPHGRGLALTLSIDCFYGIPAVKCALTGSFLLLSKTSALHSSGTVPDVTSYDVSVKNE